MYLDMSPRDKLDLVEQHLQETDQYISPSKEILCYSCYKLNTSGYLIVGELTEIDFINQILLHLHYRRNSFLQFICVWCHRNT